MDIFSFQDILLIVWEKISLEIDNENNGELLL